MEEMPKVIEIKQEEIDPSADVKPEKTGKGWIVMLVCGSLCFAAGLTMLLLVLLRPIEEVALIKYPAVPSTPEAKEEQYSLLTGAVLPPGARQDAPVYCVQTPNGLDGARPQVGLDQAGVIFEAIAEAGITRFAVLYQEPTSAVIGPIRSLRMYYLEWDSPFDCTIVHAGGADDALQALRVGGYRDLTENYSYMYRGTSGSRLWNNLFTTPSSLAQFNADRGYERSEIKGFPRLTPSVSDRGRIDELSTNKLNIVQASSGDTSAMVAKVSSIRLRYGSVPSFNVNYDYDVATNTYFRSYESGDPHNIYSCPAADLGEVNPEDNCELTQLTASVVIAMVVQERRASDGYHEDITAISSGEAYVFQNGIAYQATWVKDSTDSQIRFIDESGSEISLAPGRTIISAIPTYGSIEY